MTVANPGNPADVINTIPTSPFNGSGAVAYTYQISKYDVTNNQYAEFLNAVDPFAANNLALYKTNSAGSGFPPSGIDLVTSATPGSRYNVKAGTGNQPVVWVDAYSVYRFVNWLSNGQRNGGTELGTYDLSRVTPTRVAGATLVIPNVDEWHKAAYYDPTRNGTGGYWKYATRSDTPPVSEAPPGGSNSANYFVSTTTSPNQLTDVGAYIGSSSYYGTYDQTGDAWNWIEDVGVAVGGSYANPSYMVGSNYGVGAAYPENGSPVIGFRVALVPEPTGGLMLAILVGFTLAHRRPYPAISASTSFASSASESCHPR